MRASWARAALVPAATLALAACGGADPVSSPVPTRAASPSPAASSPSPAAAFQGALHLTAQTVASGLQVPWALAFGADGSIWVTERPGRVRVIRGGALLPDPALTLSVVAQPGCEGGVLGLALRAPYAYVFYTYAGAGGNSNRISRFTIQTDHLVAEKVLLDGIPGGACYHDGGRLVIGPDGLLYATTGEGWVASRAAVPTNLSGKILRLRLDGTGEEVFAWGFRNPQGLAFDPAGRLYASSNGPTGDGGLCCHDEIDLVQQGGFYGWPWLAAETRTTYSGSGQPAARVAPLMESGGATVWAPSGVAFYSPSAAYLPALFVAELSGHAIARLLIDPANPAHILSYETVFQGAGRMRDVEAGPDGCLYALTSNRDGRGTPIATDDRVLRLCPSQGP